jgi:hypothetical protein
MTRVGVLVLVVVAITSALACALGGRRGVSRLGAAVVVLVETVGATALFFAANVVIAVMLVLTARRLTPYYMTLYDAADLTLLILSMMQAVTFRVLGGGLRPPSQSEGAPAAPSDIFPRKNCAGKARARSGYATRAR